MGPVLEAAVEWEKQSSTAAHAATAPDFILPKKGKPEADGFAFIARAVEAGF